MLFRSLARKAIVMLGRGRFRLAAASAKAEGEEDNEQNWFHSVQSQRTWKREMRPAGDAGIMRSNLLSQEISNGHDRTRIAC